jgi:VWFA-related protein
MRIPTLLTAGVAAALVTFIGTELPQARFSQQKPAETQPQNQNQQPPPQDQQQPPPPRIKSGINFVRVDVIITDRQGNPVLDLKQDEFRLKEDGKPQTIESFSTVKIVDEMSLIDSPHIPEIKSLSDEMREAARPDVRLFVLFLDDYHVRRGNDMSVRAPLIDFVQNQLGPADMVAIMYPLQSINALSFTRNRKALISAIEHFEGRRFNYLPRNEFEEKYAYYPASVVERIRNEVTMSAIKGAAIKLGGMREGRKSIILVSEGFTNILPPQMNDPIAAMPGIGNSSRTNSMATNSDRAEFMAKADMLNDLSLIFAEANRSNVSIYAVDPRGLAPFEYDINQNVGLQTDKLHLDSALDNLRALADNTDGRAIINRNDLAKGMQQIVRDSSGYYLLGYNSSEAPTDGQFHRIEVEVTRKGLQVRARKGYWAYTAEDAARANAPARPEAPPAVANALATLADPPKGRPARFWTGTARGENGKTRVTFSWEPIAPTAAERKPGAEPPSHVTLTALAPDGRPLFRGRVPEQPAAAAGTPLGASVPSSSTFEVPPGQLQMRISVLNADGQVMDSTLQELMVPDYTTVQVSFATPRIFRARSPRDVKALMADSAAPPTADRTFSRTERIFLRVEAYAPGASKPAVTARLLNRDGTPMSDVPVRISETGIAELDLALGSYAAGDYLLELTATAEGGTAQEVVAFRVGR